MSQPVPEIAVADTHALLWWLGGRWDKFGRRARQFFERVDAGMAVVYVPAWALVEASEAIYAGRASEIREPFESLVRRMETTPSQSHVVPLTASIVLRAHDLYAIPERGDRLIAATAAELGHPLVTRDREIVAAFGGDHVW